MPIGKGTAVEAFIDNLQSVGELAAKPASQWSPSEGIIGNVVRTACNGWSTSPTSNIPFGASNNFMRELCNPYFNSIGAEAPEGVVPFPGGQCPGVTYRVRAMGPQASTGDDFQWALVDVVGPISVAEVIRRPFQFDPALTQVGWKIVSASGVTDNPRLAFEGCSGPSCTSGLRIVISRLDGLPDNCGDPRVVYRPGTAPVYVYGSPAGFRDGDVDFTYIVNPPQITPDRGIEWKVEFPEFDIDLFSGSSSDGADGGSSPPGAGEPFGPPQAIGEEGGEGDADGREIRGLHLVVPDVPETPRVEFGSPNELYYNLGWVAFGNEVAFGSYERIISDDQWFDAPDGSTRYRVKLNPFVTAIVQLYVEPED